MQSRERKGFVELEWVCPNCNSRNKGSKKTCENCGAPQPANVQFQRAADEKILTDEKVIEAAQAGADIHCGFCGARNPATAVVCSQCGGELKEGKARQSGQVLQAALLVPTTVTCTNCGTENSGRERVCTKCGSPLPTVARAAPMQTQSSKVSADVKKKPNWLLFGGVGAALLLCCAAILFLFVFPTKSVQGTVTEVSWQTSVPVQELQPVSYTNESGNPPSDAYSVSCHNEDKQVCQDKTIDKGNGYAEVVKDCHTETTQYCNYTVDEWTTIQTYDLSGNDFNPIYANPTITSSQRTGAATEQLSVTFATSNGQETYSPASITEFQKFQVGSTWKLRLNTLGGIVDVSQ